MGKPVNKTLRIAAMSAGEEIGHVSGPIVTFRGNGDPLRSLLVNIDPVQAGSGDPSPDNVRPISGWSAVNVWRTGKNLFDPTNVLSLTVTNDIIKSSPNAKSIFCACKPNTTYTISKILTSRFGVGYTKTYPDVDVPMYSYTTHARDTVVTVTTGEEAAYIFASVYNSRSDSMSLDSVIQSIQIESGSRATPYEPYSGNQYTIQLGQTVYGGTLDVTNGVLTVRPYYGSYNGEPLVGPWISSMDAYAPGATPTTGAQVVDLGGTPITISLTPTEISTLEGQNNVWADSGDVDVEYIATGGEGGKLALLLRNRKELLIALRKGLSPAEVGLLGSIPSFGVSLSPGVIRPGLNTQEEEEDEKDDA